MLQSVDGVDRLRKRVFRLSAYEVWHLQDQQWTCVAGKIMGCGDLLSAQILKPQKSSRRRSSVMWFACGRIDLLLYSLGKRQRQDVGMGA